MAKVSEKINNITYSDDPIKQKSRRSTILRDLRFKDAVLLAPLHNHNFSQFLISLHNL